MRRWSRIPLTPRLVIEIGITATVALAAMIAVIAVTTRSAARDSAYARAEEIAQRHSAEIEARMGGAMATARDLARALEAGIEHREALDRAYLDRMFVHELGDDAIVFGTWAMFEPGRFDGRDAEFAGQEGQSSDGSYSPYAYREGGAVVLKHSTYAEDKDEGYYTTSMRSKREAVIEPYVDSEANGAVMSSVTVPVMDRGAPIGVAGVDLLLTSFSDIAAGIKPFGTGYTFILGNSGVIAGYPDKRVAGRNGEEIGVSPAALEAVRQGREYEERRVDAARGGEYYFRYVPIRIGGAAASWSLAVGIPMDAIMDGPRRMTAEVVAVGAAGILALLVVIVLVARSFVRPVHRTVERLLAIADGDMTIRLDVDAIGELSELAASFNAFAEHVHEVMIRMRRNSDTLVRSSANLGTTANLLSGTAADVQERARQSGKEARNLSDSVELVAAAVQESSSRMAGVSTAVEEMVASANDIASGAEEMSATVSSVSAAIEEMSASIREVAQNCVSSADAGRRSNEKSLEALAQITTLSDAARRIGKVVELIEDIAAQTNLLALNATIEAASAGEAGKGFAVVAGEVKALARQTAKATDDIAERVAAMQAGTETAVAMIRDVAELSTQVDSLTTAISAAVEEQSATTNEVAKNMSSGALAARDISGSVQRISARLGEVAESSSAVSLGLSEMASLSEEAASTSAALKKAISSVARSVDDVAGSAEGLSRESAELKGVAGVIDGLVSQFRL